MQKALFSIIVLLCLFSCKKQEINPSGTTVITPLNTLVTFGASKALDSDLKEASGIIADRDGQLWVNLDAGNEAILYQVNTQGEISKTMEISSVQNNDWEDLAFENDNLYVGDFGNNDNDRTDLAVFKLNNFSEINAATATPEKIFFSLEGQTSFPPSNSELHFDIEAFVATTDKLYLFTKDRSEPFQGITKLYELPNEPGTYEAKLLSTYSTASNDKSGAITAATINAQKDVLVLLSEQKLYLFRDFQIPDFFGGTVEIIDLPYERQFEGIDFHDNCNLYLVSEKKYGEDAKLLDISICD